MNKLLVLFAFSFFLIGGINYADASVTTSPEVGSIVLEQDDTFVLTVTPSSIETLHELEVDHSLEGTLPEFSLYVPGEGVDVCGSESDCTAFNEKGINISWENNEWIIDFGETLTNHFIETGITFYFVLKDAQGESLWGSMNPTAPDNTFQYTITRAELEPSVSVSPNIGKKVYNHIPFVFSVQANDIAVSEERVLGLEVDVLKNNVATDLDFWAWGDADYPAGSETQARFTDQEGSISYSESNGWTIDFGNQFNGFVGEATICIALLTAKVNEGPVLSDYHKVFGVNETGSLECGNDNAFSYTFAKKPSSSSGGGSRTNVNKGETTPLVLPEKVLAIDGVNYDLESLTPQEEVIVKQHFLKQIIVLLNQLILTYTQK